jgi:regulator of RNase E activity RraB
MIESPDYETLMLYTIANLERLFMLAALVYKQYQDLYQTVDSSLHAELERQYRDKVNQVLCIDLGSETNIAPDVIKQFVEEIEYLFLEKPDACLG